jgi:hypothetical protein
MTILDEKIKDAPVLQISMRNGEVVKCRFRNREGNVLLVDELDLNDQPLPHGEMLVMSDEISHIRFPAPIEAGAYEQGFAPKAEGQGQYAEAIQQAKSRYRSNEFSMTSPQKDGLEVQRFRPRIEE